MQIPETELHLNARNTADNGISYGVSIEMEVNTSATNNGDEVWAFVSGDFGRIEMGDQDDATNRMFITAHQARQGASGPAGGLLGLGPIFHGSLNENFLVRSDWQPFTSGDHTKIIYFSPRFSGFQVGGSFTPDAGSDGADFGERDDDGDFENIFGLGLNYVGKFDDVGISASITYETGEGTDAVIPGTTTVSGAATNEDLEFLGIGVKVDFAGFSVGANWHDANDTGLTSADTAAGADAGSYWAVGAGYSQGPWGIGAWYSDGERDHDTSTEVSVTRWGIGGRYSIAPGWTVFVDYNDNEHENKNGVAGNNNDSRALAITQLISF